MDIVNLVDTAVSFGKEKIDQVLEIWDNMEEDKKKLLVGCVAAAACIIVVASIAYSIGKAHGERIAFEEEDF